MGCTTGRAQLAVTEGAAMGMTPQDLVEQWLVGQGVFVSNCTFNGSTALITSNQVGTFTATGNAIMELGLPAGVLLTSGQASLAIGPNTSSGSGASTPFGGDPDLNILAAPSTTLDKAVIEFDFIPQSDTLKFKYVFGSEEFYEYCNQYNDAFGFFLSGPGISGTFSNSSVNIALMPGSASPVTINNLCANPESNWNNAGGVYYQYDGMSYVFTAWHVVTPCSTYHIKLAIADAVDRALDSGVFLEKNSFNSTGLLVNNSYAVPKLGTKAVEGCNEVTISFVLSQPMSIPYIVHYTIGGTAIRGIDYTDIPDSLIIPPGQDSIAIVIDPLTDGIPEGVETCVLSIEQPSCSGTTIYHDSIYLFDPSPIILVPENDTTICQGDSARLVAIASGGEKPYNYLWNVPLGSDTAIWVKPPPGPNLFHVTVTDLCGTEGHDTAIVTVNPRPQFTNTALTQTICPGGTTNILFQTNTPSTFTWTAVNPGGNLSGYGPGSGPAIIQTLFNNSVLRDSVLYTVIPSAQGCTGGDTVFTAVVHPLPDVIVNNATPSICHGQTVNITLTSSLPGAVFTRTATCSSPSVTGYTSGTGSMIGDKIYNTGNTIDTVKYFIHSTANGCDGPVVQVNVVVNPDPVITNTQLTPTICSGTSPMIALTSNVIGATFSWTSSLMSGTVTGFSGGTGNTIDQVLTNPGIIPGMVRYRVTPSANACAGPPVDFDVTVNPQALVTNPATSYPVCSGNAANIGLVSNIAGTTFSWTAIPGSLALSGYTNGSGNLISDILVNSGTQTDSVEYTVIPSAFGCSGTPRLLYAVVYPTPDAVSTPPAAAICSGQTTAFSLSSAVSGATFSWSAAPSSGNVAGFSAGTGNSIAQTLTNTGNVTESVTYTVTPAVAGCPPGPAITVTATVYPVPSLTNSPLSKSICSNAFTAINLTSNVTGALFTWTCTPSSGSVTGWSNNAIPAASIDHQLISSSFIIETVTYHITPIANGCFGPVADYTVTVYPTPDLTTTPLSAQICKGQSTNILLTSNVAGTGFTWTCTQASGTITGWAANPGPPATTISQVLDLSVNYTDSVIYHITPLANGCTGMPYNFTQLVNPVPMVITHPMWDSICSGTQTNIVLTATCAGTTYDYTAAQGIGNVTGFSNGAGSPIIQTLTNNLATTGSVIYTIIPSTSTCTGNDTTFTQYVKPTPNLTNSPLSSGICNNTFFNLNLTSDVTGTLFTWTCTPSSAAVTGWSNNSIPAGSINHQLISTSNNAETVTYHITPLADGCNGPVSDYVVTVFPTATMTNTPAQQSQCNNLFTNLTLTSNVAGTLFTWTCTPSSAAVTGWSNNAVPAGSIDHQLVSASNVIESVTYHIIPAANGCNGIPSDYTVTVFPSPGLSNSPASQSQCNNLFTNINLTSNVAGTLFTWTAVPSSAAISGWSNNAVPSATINHQLVSSSFIIETVTYQITPIANGCSGNITPYTVTVFPTPDLSNSPPALQICNNTSTNVTLTSNVAGTMFTWTCAPSSANITGWANNPVPATLLNQTLTNLGFNTEWVTYAVTPTANGCAGPVTDYTVTVVQTPDVFFNPPAQTICSQQTSSIQVLSSVPGTTFAWTATPSGPTITGQSAGSGNLIAQTIANTGNVPGTVTYTVTPTAFGCPPGNSQNAVLTINPTPAVSNAVTSFQICSGAATNIIPTSTVTGSAFSWTASGSSANVTGYSNGAGNVIAQPLTNTGFNIEAVTYQVTPSANGCPGLPTPFTVTVFPVANVIFTPGTQAFCTGGTTAINLSSGVAGTSFTWTASGSGPSLSGFLPGSGNLIQQTLFNSGPYPETATYMVAPSANGCPGAPSSLTVTVNPNPAVSFTPCFDPAVSVNAQPVELKGALPLGGMFSGNGVTAGIFYPGFAGPGVHSIKYTYINTWGCQDSASTLINVISLLPFACGSALTDPRDNQSYPTVLIGTQCWMSANLNYGNTIPSGQMQRDNCVPEKYCYGDNAGNCASTGGMYQWDELMRFGTAVAAQGMCPPEWHVPSEADWNTLFSFYISNGFAGSPLKYTGFSGFNALLTGTRFNNVQWDFSNWAVMFWSSSAHGARKAWAHGMNTYNPSVSFYPSHRNNAFFVRCIKN